MRLPTLVLITTSLVFACSGGSPDANVTIPVTVADMTLQVGSIDGDDASVFGRVGGLIADGNTWQEGRFEATAQAAPVTIRVVVHFTEAGDEEVYLHLPSAELP